MAMFNRYVRPRVLIFRGQLPRPRSERVAPEEIRRAGNAVFAAFVSNADALFGLFGMPEQGNHQVRLGL